MVTVKCMRSHTSLLSIYFHKSDCSVWRQSLSVCTCVCADGSLTSLGEHGSGCFRFVRSHIRLNCYQRMSCISHNVAETVCWKTVISVS